MTGDLVSPRERGKYQGLFGAAFGLATIVSCAPGAISEAAAEPRVLSSCHPRRTGSNNLRNSPLFAGVFWACRPSQPGFGHFVGENLILTQTRR
jgi:hypothetical protein